MDFTYGSSAPQEGLRIVRSFETSSPARKTTCQGDSVPRTQSVFGRRPTLKANIIG